MFSLLLFLGGVFVVSFSGAVAPGPVTATTVSLGVRQKYAGTLLALGHGIIEVPLVLLIASGLGGFLKITEVQVVIGLAGGVFLILMGIGMFRDASNGGYGRSGAIFKNPVAAGIFLSVSNPYFLVWWVIVGGKLITEALSFGWIVIGPFILAHWLADLIWFQFLSSASNKGAAFFGEKKLSVAILVCSFVLVFFGVVFLFDAVREIIKYWLP